jgi:hypothetical protein
MYSGHGPGVSRIQCVHRSTVNRNSSCPLHDLRSVTKSVYRAAVRRYQWYLGSFPGHPYVAGMGNYDTADQSQTALTIMQEVMLPSLRRLVKPTQYLGSRRPLQSHWSTGVSAG